MDVTADSSGNLYWLLLIPGDGNCLFGSIAHQLYGVSPNDESFKGYCLQLRAAAISEIEDKMDVYYGHLATIANEVITEHVATHDKVLVYLSKLKTSGYWGGAECISAIANRLNVVVIVYQHGTKIEFRPHVTEQNDLYSCHIYYRSIHRTGEEEYEQAGVNNHYDSVIRILPYNPTLSEALNSIDVHRSEETRSRMPQPSELASLSVSDIPIQQVIEPLSGDRKRPFSGPLLIAAKVARGECTGSQESIHPPIKMCEN